MRVTRGFIVAVSLCSVSCAARAAPGDCYLGVGGRTYLDGPCNVMIQSDGSFSIGAGERTRSRYFAYVFLDPGGGKGSATWNSEPNSNHAETSLGTVVRHGGCWVNAQAKVCAWRPGTRPNTF